MQPSRCLLRISALATRGKGIPARNRLIFRIPPCLVQAIQKIIRREPGALVPATARFPRRDFRAPGNAKRTLPERQRPRSTGGLPGVVRVAAYRETAGVGAAGAHRCRLTPVQVQRWHRSHIHSRKTGRCCRHRTNLLQRALSPDSAGNCAAELSASTPPPCGQEKRPFPRNPGMAPSERLRG